MPSVDRVGRYFPLTLACPLPATANPLGVLTAAAAWYQSAETLLLTCLEQEDLPLEDFDRKIMALGPPPDPPQLNTPPVRVSRPPGAYRCPAISPPSVPACCTRPWGSSSLPTACGGRTARRSSNPRSWYARACRRAHAHGRMGALGLGTNPGGADQEQWLKYPHKSAQITQGLNRIFL